MTILGWARMRRAERLERAVALARAEALDAVRLCREPRFAPKGVNPPGEGPLTIEGYRYVAARPDEFFVCASCGEGPWHSSWTGSYRRLRALGPCCSGAD